MTADPLVTWLLANGGVALVIGGYLAFMLWRLQSGLAELRTNVNQQLMEMRGEFDRRLFRLEMRFQLLFTREGLFDPLTDSQHDREA